MFKRLLGKIGLAAPEKKKLPTTRETAVALSHDVIEKLHDEFKKPPDELNKKIQGLIDSKSEQIKANAEAVKME